MLKDKCNGQGTYGIDNFTDMVGDETIAEDPETLVAFLTEKNQSCIKHGSDDVIL